MEEENVTKTRGRKKRKEGRKERRGKRQRIGKEKNDKEGGREHTFTASI